MLEVVPHGNRAVRLHLLDALLAALLGILDGHDADVGATICRSAASDEEGCGSSGSNSALDVGAGQKMMALTVGAGGSVGQRADHWLACRPKLCGGPGGDAGEH